MIINDFFLRKKFFDLRKIKLFFLKNQFLISFRFSNNILFNFPITYLYILIFYHIAITINPFLKNCSFSKRDMLIFQIINKIIIYNFYL